MYTCVVHTHIHASCTVYCICIDRLCTCIHTHLSALPRVAAEKRC